MVMINRSKCNDCGVCIPYCTVGAIQQVDGATQVNRALCTECYVCVRNRVCGHKALERDPLNSFVEQFKHVLSDPTETTAETGVPGRGTEESKTNDVTGRVKRGEIGFCLDMGRPGVGCSMRDVEKVAMAAVAAGLQLEGEENTPLGKVMADPSGKIREDMLDQYLLSIIIEGKCPEEKFDDIMTVLMQVAGEIDTVFSLGLVSRVDNSGRASFLPKLEKYGLPQPYRAKVNVGLGLPLVNN